MKYDVDAVINTRFAYQIFQIVELTFGVGAAVCHDNGLQIPFQQRIDPRIFKMSAIRQKPVFAVATRKTGKHFGK